MKSLLFRSWVSMLVVWGLSIDQKGLFVLQRCGHIYIYREAQLHLKAL